MSPKVRKVVDYMSSNLDRKLTLNGLARLVKLSRSRLCFTFKAQMGMPVGQYLKALRIQKARALLETTSLSVKEIAAFVGMKDQSHFVRDFKRTSGLTPSEYREKASSL
jgi:transcriptional regulator GlxA family with amidase domain